MNILIEDAKLSRAVNTICQLVDSVGGRACLVGGCVRDFVLEMQSKDIDIEVYRIEPRKLSELLSQHFRVDQVGQSFGVLKIRDLDIDVSVPRRESKSGLGHKGFEINSDPYMSPKEASSRRDFTINAMAYDPIRKEVIDPFEGMKDLNKRILRHTSEKFSEDPLRVLRGMQFAARFDLEVSPDTVQLCNMMEPEGLAPERIFDEWKKLILRGIRPSKGLKLLRDCGWVGYFPELKALIGCEQDQKWHPEGDVWKHTLHCMDAFAKERIGDEWEDLIVGFAVLCHDFGKPETTEFIDGRICSHGHEVAGIKPTVSFLKRMTTQGDFVEAVSPLVSTHLRPIELFKMQPSDRAIRRLARNVKRIDRLVRVAKADQMGRTPNESTSFPAGNWLLDRARTLNVENSVPKHVVMGRHLIELGLKPGPCFKVILEACYEAQIEGEILSLEDGIDFAKNFIAKREYSIQKDDPFFLSNT